MQKVKVKADIIVTLPSNKSGEEIAEILFQLELRLNKMKSMFFPKNDKYYSIFTRFHFDGASVEEVQ